MRKRKAKVKRDVNVDALETIARMGMGIRSDVIDWSAIGKNAVALARKVLAGRCECCGREKVWQGD